MKNKRKELEQTSNGGQLWTLYVRSLANLDLILYTAEKLCFDFDEVCQFVNKHKNNNAYKSFIEYENYDLLTLKIFITLRNILIVTVPQETVTVAKAVSKDIKHKSDRKRENRENRANKSSIKDKN